MVFPYLLPVLLIGIWAYVTNTPLNEDFQGKVSFSLKIGATQSFFIFLFFIILLLELLC